MSEQVDLDGYDAKRVLLPGGMVGFYDKNEMSAQERSTGINAPNERGIHATDEQAEGEGRENEQQ